MSLPARNPDVVCTELEDGAVLLNMETRLYYSLNESALELWNLVDGRRTAPQIGEALTARCEIEPEAARDIASRFVGELEEERLVVSAPSPEPAAAGGSGAPPPAEPGGSTRKFVAPELIKHDEPLHEVPSSPFDPQLPLAE